jgi:diguanylate cyclase (GGDEF)-like protein
LAHWHLEAALSVTTTPGTRVLLVDGDPELRRLVRVALEMDGAEVIEAASLAEARAQLVEGAAVDSVVVEQELPDGEVGDLLPFVHEHIVDARVVVLTDPGRDVHLSGVHPVSRGDLSGLTHALALPGHTGVISPRTAIELLRREAETVAAEWEELCLWDPNTPPDSQPPLAVEMVRALSSAMERPQPLGWGADPDMEALAEDFAGAVGTLDVAIGQLVCLREVLRRRLAPAIPPEELPETLSRMHMIIDRALQTVATHMAVRLEHEALVDPLTGLLNRRALERDLRRERARAIRYDRRFSLMVIDLDGLKTVNDTDGHLAGDLYLRALATALAGVLRSGDEAYRIGGDEFVVLLPETAEARAEVVAERVQESGAPPFSWGAATFGPDGQDPDALLSLADQRLYARRAVVRGDRASR